MPYPPTLIDTTEATRFRVEQVLDRNLFRVHDGSRVIAWCDTPTDAEQVLEALRIAAGER